MKNIRFDVLELKQYTINDDFSRIDRFIRKDNIKITKEEEIDVFGQEKDILLEFINTTDNSKNILVYEERGVIEQSAIIAYIFEVLEDDYTHGEILYAIKKYHSGIKKRDINSYDFDKIILKDDIFEKIEKLNELGLFKITQDLDSGGYEYNGSNVTKLNKADSVEEFLQIPVDLVKRIHNQLLDSFDLQDWKEIYNEDKESIEDLLSFISIVSDSEEYTVAYLANIIALKNEIGLSEKINIKLILDEISDEIKKEVKPDQMTMQTITNLKLREVKKRYKNM